MIHQAKSFAVQVLLPAGLLVATAYNAAMTVNGPDGRRAHALIAAEAEQARAALAEARTRTAHLSARADGLMLATLDHDLLDERLRARLGLARPGERMVRMNDVDRIAGTRAEADDRMAALDLAR